MTSTNTSVKVDELAKKFCRNLRRSLWYGVRDLGAELLLRDGGRGTLRTDEFWALENISFEAVQGETLGIIGHNGAGKSTLLKIINGVIKPDGGRIELRGRVGALIDLGLGFNPVLTGRENIYVNAAVLGISGKDVRRLLDDIVGFAEIGEFIDAPVQSYSSGMKVRLGFSIAANLNPEILLIDEVLSVGDASFRERSYNRLLDFKRGGGTIIFVSHNATAVETVCDKVMLLDHGNIVSIGDPVEIVDSYEKKALEIGRAAARDSSQNGSGEDEVNLSSLMCFDLEGRETTSFEYEEPFEMRLTYSVAREIERPTFYIGIKKGWSSVPFCAVRLVPEDAGFSPINGNGTLKCVIRDPRFSPGEYEIVAGVLRNPSGAIGQKYYAPLRTMRTFEISKDRFAQRYPALQIGRSTSVPPIMVDHDWEVIPSRQSEIYGVYTTRKATSRNTGPQGDRSEH